jgi:G3E family GTPase
VSIPVPFDELIRLNILSGFLGAGKSTWLQHQLHTGALGPAEVLVNEAAEIPVDHLFADRAARLTVLPDGCCCCDGAPTLREGLRAVCARADEGLRTPALWLETSGLADPARIVRLVQDDPMLGRRMAVDRIVLVVDPVNLEAQLRETALAARQIRTATEIVVAKTDGPDGHTLSRAAATIRMMNPGAAIAFTARGHLANVYVDDAAPAFPTPANQSDPPQAVAVSLTLDETCDWAALSVWLSAILFVERRTLLRLKGIVSTPAGKLLIQSVRDSMQAPRILPAGTPQPAALVLIGPGLNGPGLQASLDAWTRRTTHPY